MSGAVRTPITRRLTRRLTRNSNSSPYSRPPRQPSSSGWSFSNFINFFIPLGRRSNPDDSGEDEEPEHDDDHGCDVTPEPQQAPGVVVAEPEPAVQVIAAPPTPQTPQTPSADRSIFGPHAPNNSPSKPQEMVTQYLLGKEREGTQLNPVEVEGLIAMLKKASDEVEVEPFRFTSSPSTPARSPQPLASSSSLFSIPQPSPRQGGLFSSTSLPTFTNPTAQTPASSPRKTLTRNPNGEYRWSGAGSARRGTPSRASSPAKSPKSVDNKRRRVGADRDSSTAESSGIRTVPSINGVNGVANSINGSAVASVTESSTPPAKGQTQQRFPRPLRASLNPRTAPAHPSPLRQSFAAASPPSSPGSPASQRTSPATSGRRVSSTRAADVLTEIIEKVEQATPRRNAAVANPYQTASPVRPTVKPREKRKTRTQTKQEAQDLKGKGKEEERPVQKDDVPSPRAIIEATVPKGAKRSRPPAALATSISQDSDTSSASRRSGRLMTPDTDTSSYIDDDAMEDDDDSPSKKKHKQTNGVVSKTIGAEEVQDVEMDTSTPNEKSLSKPFEAGTLPTMNGGTHKPIISAFSSELFASANEPSNAFGSTTSPNPFALSAVPPPAPPVNDKPALFAPAPLKSSVPKEPSKLRASFTVNEDDGIQRKVDESTPKISAPKTNGFTTSATSSAQPLDPQASARALSVSALPVYTFTLPPVNRYNLHDAERSLAKGLPNSALPTFDLSKPAPGSVSISPMLMPKPAPGFVSILPMPVPKPGASDKPAGFDWAAAGIAPPNTSGWKCGTCNLQNPMSATEKCTVCESPKPGAVAATAPAPLVAASAPVQGFNWAAAGLAPPSAAGWKCGTCDLQNPVSATKCTVCETPKPGAVSTSAPTAPAPPVVNPPIQGFNWAAAGLAPKPANGGAWSCSLCGLQNPASATEKCTVCETPR